MHAGKTLYTRLPLIAALVLLVSCASNAYTPSDATLSGDPESMWTDGQVMAKRGESLISKGEKLLADVAKQMTQGQQMVHSGNATVAASRIEYQNAVRVLGDATTPKLVGEESKRLKKIGRQWQDGIDAIRDGNKLLAKATENNSRGQATIREGRMLLDEGSNLMRRSQQLRVDAP